MTPGPGSSRHAGAPGKAVIDGTVVVRSLGLFIHPSEVTGVTTGSDTVGSIQLGLMGDHHARRGEWQAARANYEAALQYQPLHDDAAASLLEIYLIQRDFPAASRMVAAFEDEPLVTANRGKLLYRFFKACTMFLVGSDVDGRALGDRLLQHRGNVLVDDWDFGPLNHVLEELLPGAWCRYLMGLETDIQGVQDRPRPAHQVGITGLHRRDDTIHHDTRHDHAAEEDEEGDVIVPNDVFIVNDHLSVHLEGGHTNIYVDGKRFNQCKYLLLNEDVEDPRRDEQPGREAGPGAGEDADASGITADEALYGRYGRLEDPGYHEAHLPARAAFWGHSSALQAWAESGYKSSLLHANMAFPLLRVLSDAGDTAAKDALEREIVSRWASGFEPVQTYLVEMGFLDALSVRGVAKILKNDKVLDRFDWLLEKFDLKDLVELWRLGDEQVQGIILNLVGDEIYCLEQGEQVKMLARCKSAFIAQRLLELVDIHAMSRGLVSKARRNAHVKKLVPALPPAGWATPGVPLRCPDTIKRDEPAP